MCFFSALLPFFANVDFFSCKKKHQHAVSVLFGFIDPKGRFRPFGVLLSYR